LIDHITFHHHNSTKCH